MINTNIIDKKKYKLIKKYEQLIMTSIPNIKFGFSDKEREDAIIKIIDRDLIDFSQTIIKEFSKENLNLFFSNITDLKIYRKGLITLYYKFLRDPSTAMEYDAEKNIIVVLPICSKYQESLVSKFLYHEFFHMASTYNDKKNKRKYVGFYFVDHNSIPISIGSGINEGYTQLMTERYFNRDRKQINISLSYKTLVIFAQQLEKIVGKEKMENLYLNANLNGLIKILSKYDNIENVIDFIHSLDCIKNNYITFKKELDIAYEEVEKIRKYLISWYAKSQLIFPNCLLKTRVFDTLLCDKMKDIGINIYPYDEKDILNFVSFDSKISCNNVI